MNNAWKNTPGHTVNKKKWSIDLFRKNANVTLLETKSLILMKRKHNCGTISHRGISYIVWLDMDSGNQLIRVSKPNDIDFDLTNYNETRGGTREEALVIASKLLEQYCRVFGSC